MIRTQEHCNFCHVKTQSTSCYHKTVNSAPQTGGWSADSYLIQNYPDTILVNIKKINAMDDSPFGSYPIDTEIRYTDIERQGTPSGYLPFKPNSYYSVGVPDGNAFLLSHSRLQKPDPKQDRAIDVYLCY